MRAISYAAERFLTSDAVANAVLQYSMVLAKHDTSDVVPIPVVFEGKVRTADIIIGPASQITAIDVDEEPDTELDDRWTRSIWTSTSNSIARRDRRRLPVRFADRASA
jgi:hypothetical protein